jgi:putative oxidoreductase
MNRIIQTKDFPALIIRLTVGFIFLSEGVQKYLYTDILGGGRFKSLGFSHPSFWAGFTGAFEMGCSLLIIIGMYTRLAVIPLLIIMVVAFITTKWPEFLDKGFWPMIHDGRTDFAMTMLLIFLLIYGSGKPSIDFNRNAKRAN